MTGRRTSARQAARAASNPSQNGSSPQAGAKRKGDTSPQSKSKKGKKSASADQSTIEDSIDVKNNGVEENAKENGTKSQSEQKTNGDATGDETAKKVEEKTKPNDSNGDTETKSKPPEKNGFNELMKTEDEAPKYTPAGTGSKVPTKEDAVEVSRQREETLPSNILEKGIIYFFFRGRVGVDDPSSVNDVARSYIVLRPLPDGAKLGQGPIGDAGHNRMLALPKKVLPVSPKDRFMTFVEKSNISMDQIKEQLSSSDYTTKTAGVRHTPAATPIGEGVYAITQTGRETHLAYIITIPSEVNDVQKGIGLRQQGSYITSAKNPKSSGPANAQLPQGAEYPSEVQEEFGNRGWMPLQPKLLDFENTQFLLIGNHSESLEKATKTQDEDGHNAEKKSPLEEIQKLEDEDEQRVEGLKDDHAVFVDLGLSAREFPKLQTTW